MTEIRFGLLGSLMVRRDGVAVTVPRGKQRVILAMLLLNAGRIVRVDELAEILWVCEPPQSGPVAVQNYVMRLRKTLGAAGRERIVTQPHGYLIHVEADELDVSRFEALLDAAREAVRDGEWDQAAARAREALALWRGETLADVDSETLRTREALRLAELRLQTLEIRIDADLHLGRHAEVIAELQQLAETHQMRERLHALLMTALYRDGRQAEALAAYQRARQVLVDELGTEPCAGLQQLHHQILTTDPALHTVERTTFLASPPRPGVDPGLASTGEGAQAKRQALSRPSGYEQGIAAPGWVESTTGRLLADGRGDEVALAIAVTRRQVFAGDPYYARVIAGAQEEAARNGLYLSVHLGSGGSVATLAPFGRDKRFIGAILVNVHKREAAFLSTLGRPLVSMGLSAAGVPSIDAHNHEGAAAVVGHLLAQGRRRTASIAGPQRYPWARERLAGYRSRVGSAGMREVVVSTDFTRRGAAQATRRLLSTHPDLDAIFAGSDLMATAALQVLAASGRQVPGDVAVAGFDDSAPALMTTPSLTTVHHPVEELAALAVRTLLAPASERPDYQRSPVHLVLRASSAS